MIANLFKHEFRRTLPGFGLIAGVGVAVVGLSALLAALLPAPLNALFSVLGIGGAIFVPTAVVVGLGIHFYRSSYSKTGYLTRALPVRGTTIYWVKFAVAYGLSLLSLLVGLGLAHLAGIGFTVAGGGTVADFNTAVAAIWDWIGSAPGWALAMILFLVLMLPVQWLASFYLASAVGSEAWGAKFGLGGPILVWFGFYVGSQAAGLLAALLPIHVMVADGGVTLETGFVNIFAMNSNDIIPVGVFLGIFALSLAALAWASVSFDRKVELR